MNFKESNVPDKIMWLSLLEKLLLIAIVLFGFLMLFIGAYHCYPNAEDFEISSGPRDVGIISSLLATMTNYDGRYSTNFLHAINPLVFNWIRGYSVMILIGVILVNVSLYFFMRVVLKPQSRFAILLNSSFISIVFMGSILCYGTFYKMAGNFVYLYPNSFVLFFIGTLIIYFKARNSFLDKVYFLFASLCLIAAIGFSELYLPFYSTLLTGALIYTWVYYKPLFYKFLPVYIIGLLCILFFVFTPGVSVRIGELNTHNDTSLIPVLRNLFNNYGQALYTAFLTPIFICSVIYIVIQFQEKILEHTIPISRTKIVTLLAIVFGITLLMTASFYLPNMDSTGYPDKIYTPILFLLFVTIFIFLCSIIKLPNFLSPRMLPYLKNFLLAVIFGNFMFGNNYIAALFADYRSGKLQKFKGFMDQRIEILSKAGKSTSPYKVACVPKLIEYHITVSIRTDSEDQRNSSKWNKYHEEYFRLDEVTVQGDTNRRF